jgi:hypothetical protein
MAYVCEISPDYSSISDLLSRCVNYFGVSTVYELSDCVNANISLSPCFNYFPPSSSSCAADTVYVDSPSGGDFAFSWASVEQGFQDAFPVFLMVFAVFIVVKLFGMARK